MTRENLMSLEESTKHAARQVLEEILEGKTQSQPAETLQLRFISASAKYLNHVRALQMLQNNPSFGIHERLPQPKAERVY
jgi:hypothetical protein